MGIKARRYADILAGAPEYVTGRQEEWKAFLATAARNYKYPSGYGCPQLQISLL